MKTLLLFCLLVGSLLAAPQDPPGILSGTFATPAVAMNRVGDNIFTLTYTSAFNAIPYFGLSLIQIGSVAASKYTVLPKILARSSINVNLNIYTPSNTWIELGFSWIASLSPALTVIQFSGYWPLNGGISTETFSSTSLNIPPGTVKVDTLIAGFDYASTNNMFNIAVVPQGSRPPAGTLNNPYSDTGVSTAPIGQFFFAGTGTLNFPYIVNYDSTAVSTFSEIVISLVVHSIIFPSSGPQSPISTGFNTMTVSTQTPYINLFNALANKNNLGVPTAQRFFGFNQINMNINPLTGISAQVTVNSLVNSSILAEPTIIGLSASYFFYENKAQNICPNANSPSNFLITAAYNNWNCKTVTNSQTPSICQRYGTVQDTYSVEISSVSPASLYLDIATVTGRTYLITFYVLDGGSSFKTPQLTVRLGTQIVTRITATPNAPWRTTTTPGTPTAAQIASLSEYTKYSVYVTATQASSRLQFEFIDLSNTNRNIYYLKAVSVSSGNLIYDPALRACAQGCFNNQMISTNTIPNVCTSCSQQGRIYDPTSGSCACPPKNYYNTITMACTQCLEPSCERCNTTNPSVCTACSVNRVLSGNRCICASGFLEVDGACVQCNPGCTSCTGNPNICASCVANTNRIQANGTCSCIAGYYDAGQANCIVCPISCLTCAAAQTATATPACTTCPAGSNRVATPVNNNCPCLQGFTERAIQSQNCQACHFSCNRCTGPNANQCIDCNMASNRIATASGTCVCMPGFSDLGFPYCVNGTSCANTPGCIACQSGVCSRCDSSQYKVYNTTLARCTCIDGYFQYNTAVSSDFTCAPCSLGCAKCTNQGACTQCYSGVANPTSCQCAIGFYPDLATLSCQPCASGCQSCSSKFTCNVCFAPLTPTSGVCVCPQGSYFSGNTCQPCSANCQACNGNGQCVLCQSGSLLQLTSTCATTCPPQTYSNGYSCLRCPNNCLICTGASSCQSCASGTYLYFGVCVNSCPDGSVATTSASPICTACNQNCLKCSGTPNICTACSTTTVLRNGVCVPACNPGETNVNGTCVQCNGCTSCFRTSQTCTSCIGGSFLVLQSSQCTTSCPIGFVTSGAVCYSTCPPGTFASGLTCPACVANCLTCSIAQNNCTSCKRNNHLLQPVGTTGRKNCVGACSAGFTEYNNQCRACNPACFDCLTGNPNSCTSCAQGYIPSNQVPGVLTCVKKCTGNTFNNGAGCAACPTTCLGCSDATTCIGCASTSAVLVGGQCSSCAPPCATCSPGSASICTSCLAPAALSGSNCVTTCPFDQQNTNGICICRSEFFTYQSQCLTSCPPLTTAVSGVCQPCSAHCSACSISPTNCTSCTAGFDLINFNCVEASICPYGQVSNSASTTCTNICSNNLFFFDTYCVTSCPTNYAPNPARSGCVFVNTTQDRQCGVGLVYYNGICLTSCPSGTFANLGSCISCSPNCASCTNTSACISCSAGYYLSTSNTCTLSNPCAAPQISFQGSCISSCPAGTYQQSFTCNRICDVGTYYYQGLCYYQSCPSNLYRTEFTCVLACPAGTTATNGACVGNNPIACSPGSYLTANGACAVCQTPCSTCVGTPTNCTACTTGTLSGNTCTNNPSNPNNPPGTVGITIQSSSIYNNRVQAKILLSNIPPTLTQLQQNQLLNVVVYPNTSPTPQVYQWIEVGGTNIVNVVIVFSGPISPSTVIYFSLNIPAVGSSFSQQGFTNFANANAQLQVSNIPQATSPFAVPAYVVSAAAQQATTARAG